MPANEMIIMFSHDILPGATDNWVWNNPALEVTYTFAAVPHNLSAPSGAWNSLEVRNVRYEEQAGTGKRRISYEVHNPTSNKINYETHMGWISQT